MRKIFAVVLVMTIAFAFAACGDSKNESTTLDPLYTAYSPVATNGQNASQSGGTGATYVLTTNQGKTAPALSTTRFSFEVAATTKATTTAPGATSGTTTTNNLTYTTSGGTITAPSVVTSKTQTTTWATIPTTTTTTKKPTTTKRTTTARPTTEPTAPPEPVAMDVVINETGTDSQGRFYAAIDSDGWGGKLKANSGRVTVYVDGVPMDEQVMLQISSSTTGDGYQYVYVNLEDYGIDTSSSTISFEIPEGFLENKAGTKYNYSVEISS